MLKTSTDLFWDIRSQNCHDARKVNIDDLVQRELECAFIGKFLKPDLHVLEVGCGNGYLSGWISKQVRQLDAFDYSGNMIAQAKQVHAQPNISYFEDNIVQPIHLNNRYDLVICVRVLINLKNFEEQKIAVRNLYSNIKKDGKLILIEGFSDGFSNLYRLRETVNLPTFSPAPINYYSQFEDFIDHLSQFFIVEEEFHTGMFDFLTRIVNPLLNGIDAASAPSEFHNKILPLCKAFNIDSLQNFSRLRGWSLKVKE
jgi:SAM-dependent methyltransferase